MDPSGLWVSVGFCRVFRFFNITLDICFRRGTARFHENRCRNVGLAANGQRIPRHKVESLSIRKIPKKHMFSASRSGPVRLGPLRLHKICQSDRSLSGASSGNIRAGSLKILIQYIDTRLFFCNPNRDIPSFRPVLFLHSGCTAVPRRTDFEISPSIPQARQK